MARSAYFNYIGGGNSQGMGFNTINFTSPGNGVAAGQISASPWSTTQSALYGASLQSRLAGKSRCGGAKRSGGGRPEWRTSLPNQQWNFSLQREVTRDLVLEASYIGNRGAWLQAGGNLISYNGINPSLYQARGIDITNPTTRTLLTSQISSPWPWPPDSPSPMPIFRTPAP